MRRTHLPLGLAAVAALAIASAFAACGGITTSSAVDGGDRDAAIVATEASSEACGPRPTDPPVLDCDAATLDGGVCIGTIVSDTQPLEGDAAYPSGCVVYLPQRFCGGACCQPPQRCSCGRAFEDSGPHWSCQI